MKGKAQASLEFLVTLSLILLIFIIIGFVIAQKFNSTTYMKFDIEGQDVANYMARGINGMASAGDGYFIYLTLPGEIQGVPYTVGFYENESILELSVLDMTWVSPLSTSQLECNLDICSSGGGTTRIELNETRRIRIENEDEVIYLKE